VSATKPLAPLAVPASSSASPSTSANPLVEGALTPLPPAVAVPEGPPHGTVECLLRARAHMERASRGYALVDEELSRAKEYLQQARAGLASEERAQAVQLGAQLSVRATEARARGEAFHVYAGEVESWARKVVPVPVVAVPAGCCRLCFQPLVGVEALNRGYHRSCPEEAGSGAAVAEEGGAA
jgi:hypothetical protein